MQEDNQQSGAWKYDGDSRASSSVPQPPASQHVSWTASEFIAHEKDLRWFALLGVGTALLMAATYLLTRDFIALGVTLLVGIVFGIYGVRQPRVLNYALDERGIQIDTKHFEYDLFKSFTVMQDGAMPSIELMPMKRFMPALTLYIDPSDEDKIADTLAAYVPFEHREQPFIDKLMRRLRF